MINLDYCMSLYLAFRWIPIQDLSWKEGVTPYYPSIEAHNQTPVDNENDIENYLREYMSSTVNKQTGILLSGGIDSAILASYLPPNTNAYTIRFMAEDAVDESIQAKIYAKAYSLNHKIVDVTWSDYKEFSTELMKSKNAPLHPVEVALFKASKVAHSDGIRSLIVGNGADSTFGGMDKLLSRDWTYEEFINRYTFIKPELILKNPYPIDDIYMKYRLNNDQIDFISFLKYTHGMGIIQAFENAIKLGGCNLIEPFEKIKLRTTLDIQRIRNGEPKYMLYDIFNMKYNNDKLVKKIPFARPMDKWLNNWEGPKRKEFNINCTKGLSGEQKYLLYSLEQFLDIIDS